MGSAALRLALLTAACALLSGCSEERDSAGAAFEPARPGVLTVATALIPAPGFWNGTAEAPGGGFEAGLAARLAERLGLERIRVTIVPFADIAAGRLGGADLALTQMTPTESREAFVDFSTEYLEAFPGVLARSGVEAVDAMDLQELRWVVVDGSTLTTVVLDRIRPDDPPLTVGSRAEALDALRERRGDAVLLDLPVALGLARAEQRSFAAIGQLSDPEAIAAALPDGSPNLEVVDSAIRSLTADGTIDDLADRWLGDSDEVPLIRVTE